MTWPGLPILVRLAGAPVILLGEGVAAAAKRRLLERAGATVVDEGGGSYPVRPELVEGRPTASIAGRPSTGSGRTKAVVRPRLAIVAIEDDAAAEAAVARLRARGLLVNAVDRPALCDFTLPAVVDRAPVLVAVATGGVSAGLAAALRQRLEMLLPAGLGDLAAALHAARARLRAAFPDPGQRRRALARAMMAGGELDPLGPVPDVDAWLGTAGEQPPPTGVVVLRLASPDPDELTLRHARLLANADRVLHKADVPAAILDRARADAARRVADAPPDDASPGLTLFVAMRS